MPVSVIAGEDLPDFPAGVVDKPVSGGRVGPPPAQSRIQDQAQEEGGSQDPVDNRRAAGMGRKNMRMCIPARLVPRSVFR